jgi:fluoride exporter
VLYEAAMSRFLLVALGGAIGSGARYLVSTWTHAWLGAGFPFGTLAVNVIGSFLICAIMQLGVASDLLSPGLRLFLTTGILGGFTTYSAFNYETLGLADRGAYGLMVTNVFVTLCSCLLAGLAGAAVARLVVRA